MIFKHLIGPNRVAKFLQNENGFTYMWRSFSFSKYIIPQHFLYDEDILFSWAYNILIAIIFLQMSPMLASFDYPF